MKRAIRLRTGPALTGVALTSVLAGVALAGLATLSLLVACSAPPASEGDQPAVEASASGDAYRTEIEEWDARRRSGLERPDGWLTLAGLYWLPEGESSFGSDSASAVVFPEKAPARMGVLRREGDRVRLRAEPEAGLTHEGEPVDEIELVPDSEDEPTVVEAGPLAFHAIVRGERVGIRLRDRESPVLAAFDGIERFPVDPEWRIEAAFEPFDPPRPVRIPNVLGDTSESLAPGQARFEREGEAYVLTPTGDAESGLFFVFGDATNGRETYGGGRFLSADFPAAGSATVILDFNKAYNPPCVFTPYATCPLPPRENKLALRIEAGEKSYGSAEAH